MQRRNPWSPGALVEMFWGLVNAIALFFQLLVDPSAQTKIKPAGGGGGGGSDRRGGGGGYGGGGGPRGRGRIVDMDNLKGPSDSEWPALRRAARQDGSAVRACSSSGTAARHAAALACMPSPRPVDGACSLPGSTRPAADPPVTWTCAHSAWQPGWPGSQQPA